MVEDFCGIQEPVACPLEVWGAFVEKTEVVNDYCICALE